MPQRNFFVQFTATVPATDATLRADSLVMNLTFPSTTSGTLVPVANDTTFLSSHPVTSSLSANSTTVANPPNNVRVGVGLKRQQAVLATRPAVQTSLAVSPNPAQNPLNVPPAAAPVGRCSARPALKLPPSPRSPAPPKRTWT